MRRLTIRIKTLPGSGTKMPPVGDTYYRNRCMSPSGGVPWPCFDVCHPNEASSTVERQGARGLCRTNPIAGQATDIQEEGTQPAGESIACCGCARLWPSRRQGRSKRRRAKIMTAGAAMAGCSSSHRPAAERAIDCTIEFLSPHLRRGQYPHKSLAFPPTGAPDFLAWITRALPSAPTRPRGGSRWCCSAKLSDQR
jgi:hypothetical protein